MERKNAWKTYSEEIFQSSTQFLPNTSSSLTTAKPSANALHRLLKWQKKGYRDLNTVIANGEKLNPGDCVYSDFMGKALMLFKIGKQPIFKGSEHRRCSY